MFLKDAIEMRINNLCKERNITINKLCTICGITQSTLANLKVRPKTNVSTITLLRICRGLNIPLQEFFNDPIFTHIDFEDEWSFIVSPLMLIKKTMVNRWIYLLTIVFFFPYYKPFHQNVGKS